MKFPKIQAIYLLLPLFFIGCGTDNSYQLKNDLSEDAFSAIPEGQYQITLSYPGKADVTALSAKIATVKMNFTLIGLLEKSEDQVDLKICQVSNIEDPQAKIFFDVTGKALNPKTLQTESGKFNMDLALTGYAETSVASPKFKAQLQIDYPVEAIIEDVVEGDESKSSFRNLRAAGRAEIPFQNFDVDRVKIVIKPKVVISLDHTQKDKRKVDLIKTESVKSCQDI